QASEMLEAPTSRVMTWLIARAIDIIKAEKKAVEVHAVAKTRQVLAGFLIDRKGKLQGCSTSMLAGFDKKENKKERDAFYSRLAGRFIIVGWRLGGLEDGGMLDDSISDVLSTLDHDPEGEPPRPFRARETADPAQIESPDWQETYRFPVDLAVDGEAARWIVIE